MAVNQSQLGEMFEQVLRLSRVDASQSVAILKSHYSDARTVQAATDAALRLGAKVYCVELPAFNHPVAMGNDMTAYCGDTALTGNTAAQRALEAADLIVDTMMLLHSPEQEQILKPAPVFCWRWSRRRCWHGCCLSKRTKRGCWRRRRCWKRRG